MGGVRDSSLKFNFADKKRSFGIGRLLQGDIAKRRGMLMRLCVLFLGFLVCALWW